ncbi:MAG: hypothetical protein OXN83_03685 [Oligoflexia bacterium]|nr:hypothetical protein [Oligoflexia bacterium]
MRLTKRDKLIISALKNQEFCFYKDITNKFFPSKSSASQSLKRLVSAQYIAFEPLEKFKKNILDDLALSFFSDNQFVIRLGDKYKKFIRKPSEWKKRHQVLLFSVKERLEELLGVPAFFDNNIRDLKYTLYDRSGEPLPDLFLRGEDYKLAIELELHIKTKKRYELKKSSYNRSSFTHVLYVVPNANKITRLIKNFKYYSFFGLSHYANLNKVSSFRYGQISLKEWLNRGGK